MKPETTANILIVVILLVVLAIIGVGVTLFSRIAPADRHVYKDVYLAVTVSPSAKKAAAEFLSPEGTLTMDQAHKIIKIAQTEEAFRLAVRNASK